MMIPDSGRNYLSKFYDDNWMLEHGFLERQAPLPTVEEVLHAKHGGELPNLVTISAHQKVGEGIDTMQRYGISQLPVIRDGSCESLADVIGSLQDRALLERVFTNPDVLHEDVATAMQPPLGGGRGDGDARRRVRHAQRGIERRRRGQGRQAGGRAHPRQRSARVPAASQPLEAYGVSRAVCASRARRAHA